jgi:hypothetical protein
MLGKKEEEYMLSKNLKNIVALSMTILIFLALIYAHIFIVTHIHHNCSGEGCPICSEIQLAKAMIQQISSAILTVIYLITFVCIMDEGISISNHVILSITPVQMKVRMND